MRWSARETDYTPLPRDFLDRATEQVARELLGMLLIRAARSGLTIGRIVETEAYLPTGDSACHAARGKSRKNASMFGRPGLTYVYAIHARWCCNVVTLPRGIPSAVLIRALEPLAGIPLMQQRRGTLVERDLARGPARLCEALSIDRALDGWDLTRGRRLWLARPAGPPSQPFEIGTSRRIGVTSAAELPLRYFVANCSYVSGPKANHAADGAE